MFRAILIFKLLTYSLLLPAAKFNCLEHLKNLVHESTLISREKILTDAVNSTLSRAHHHGVELKGSFKAGKLTTKELDEQLQNLVQHSGFYPKVLERKDILERGEVFLAYPLNISGNDLRLVMEYKTSIGNVNIGSKTEAYLNKMYVTDRFGEKVPVIEKTVRPEKILESFRIVPQDTSIKKSFTLAELNQEVVNNLGKAPGKIIVAEQNIRNKLLEELNTIANNDQLSSIDREMARFNLILKNISHSQSSALSNLTVNKDVVNFYPVLSEEILKKYSKFMTDFYYSPYKGTKILRTQERLQNIKNIRDLSIYHKLIKSENLKNWLFDRTTRHIGGIPIGLLVGGFSAYMVKKSGKKDKDDNYDLDQIAEPGGDATVVLFYHGENNDKVKLLLFENLYNKKNTSEKFFIIPDDQKHPLWKKSSVFLETGDGVKVKFNVHKAKNRGHTIIYLTRE